ncbi:hypothetical protein ACFX2F_045335 [Malus domestica]
MLWVYPRTVSLICGLHVCSSKSQKKLMFCIHDEQNGITSRSSTAASRGSLLQVTIPGRQPPSLSLLCESLVRRNSCFADIRYSVGFAGGLDIRNSSQKLTCRFIASSVLIFLDDLEFSSLIASAQSPQIHWSWCLSFTVATYADVHFSVKPQQ